MRCHEQMAELQDLFHNGFPEDLARIRGRFTGFSADVKHMIETLEKLEPGVYSALHDYHRKFDFYTRFLLAPPRIDTAPPFVLGLNEIPSTNLNVGNKTRNLSILRNVLGIATPDGFAVPASAYHYFIAHNQLRPKIDELLAQLAIDSPSSLHNTSNKLMELIRRSPIPPDLAQEIDTACHTLSAQSDDGKFAVRSSGLGEDGDSSFAGQFATYLNQEKRDVLEAYKNVLASKYSPEALYYRIHQGWGDEETAMTALVMPMVPARYSGVLYTGTVVEGGRDKESLHLHVVEGLGENLVGGMAVPAKYLISRTPPHTITPQPPATLASSTLRQLAMDGLRVEQYFNADQDIEWSIDHHGNPFILQARNLHSSRPSTGSRRQPHEKYLDDVVVTDCERASSGRAAGPVFLLDEHDPPEKLPTGCVLVTRNTPPCYVRFLQNIAAVLSSSGSKASHFATVAREFSIPYLSGIPHCSELFTDGELVTVDGYSGTVYKGVVSELLEHEPRPRSGKNYRKIVGEAATFITSLDLTDPAAKNFTPEGCRSMHDIIRFCHEKALQTLFNKAKPGSARNSRRLLADIPLDVYLFDIGGGVQESYGNETVPLSAITSSPFLAVWRGLSHPGVRWKQKPFDWNAYERIELSGAVPPKQDDFVFASFAVIGSDYLHFHLRFGYHFTILDTLCGPDTSTNHCMIRFAGGGGDYDHRALRIQFLAQVLRRLDFHVECKGDLLEAKVHEGQRKILLEKLDRLGRLLGATKLMDMVLVDEKMVERCVEEFFQERYSFSERG